ncbi:MAG: chorismate-binding protein [Actinomycetaceae bacterium]|nr:chorismate-binding protein [Actinomycetaceae bacterium]MDY5854306.1 chorismate-binding protein [Arcanobacterium sp.]
MAVTVDLAIADVRAYTSYTVVPIAARILADSTTPINVLRALQSESSHCYVLESAEQQHTWGRYTFLGYKPREEVTAKRGSVRHRIFDDAEVAVKTTTYQHTPPREIVEEILARFRAPARADLPPFTGGLVGYFGYDYVTYAEPQLVLDAADEEGFNDLDLMLFDTVICFDHYRQEIIVIAHVRIPENSDDARALEANYAAATAEIEHIVDLIRSDRRADIVPSVVTSEFRALFDEERFCAMVEKAQEYIREGDIFQVVLSNRLDADFSGSLLNAYRYLRTINPSPYMFYFSSDDMEVAGASPETLVKLHDGVLHTFPLAGTRARVEGDDARNEQLERELLADEKELAEHNMLVDLGRNDLGKISRFGSVRVEEYMQLQRFSHVVHLGSTVRGDIRRAEDPGGQATAMDAVEAVLPAGTLSGAPKLRAMQIINELENNKRGIYGGAVGYIDFAGNLDTAIGIRLAYKKNGKVFVRSGAGIVLDSVPANEYRECINKAQAVVMAIRKGQEVA